MDIRTKLALALVSVSLLSMAVLGAFSYQVTAKMLQEISERQLEALAETKKQDLQQVVAGWRENVRLIRSRTQLRFQLRHFNETGDTKAIAAMQRILRDAQESTQNVDRITLFGVGGRALVSAGHADSDPDTPEVLDDPDVRYSGFYLGADDKPKVVFHSLMRLDGQTIGSIEVVIDVTNVEQLADNYEGLGETGETLVIGRNAAGELTLLHSLRHTEKVPALDPLPAYVAAAVSGIATVFTEDVHDYRGHDVWAATRYLPEVDWGLCVKVDAEEETRRARELRESMIDLGLALGAFAVAGGTLLGFYLARPIRSLADFVKRVHEGEHGLRADARSDDEIGLLAEALNDYLDHLDKYHGNGSSGDTPDDDRRT